MLVPRNKHLQCHIAWWDADGSVEQCTDMWVHARLPAQQKQSKYVDCLILGQLIFIWKDCNK